MRGATRYLKGLVDSVVVCAGLNGLGKPLGAIGFELNRLAQRRPVLERRVFYFASRKPVARRRVNPVKDLAAPALDIAQRHAVRRNFLDIAAHKSARQLAHRLAQDG